MQMKFHINKNYFLYFVMIVFVFLASSAMSLSTTTPYPPKKITLTFLPKEFPANPILRSGSSLPVVSAQGVMVVDLGTGISLYEKNPDAKLLPASTTKIITALVALDVYPLDQILTVPKGAGVDGQKMGLYSGEQMRVKDLLYGLLVYSANDAAMTLAGSYPGGYDAFVDAMNIKARDLSMENSKFTNPVGLDGDSQRSTAKDMIRVSEVAMRNPEFAKIVGTKSVTLTDAAGKIKYNLGNVNELLGEVPGVLGVKTGWTENARENLVTYVERDNHKVMIAILGSQDRFGETKELIDWTFSNYEWQEVKVPIALDNNLQSLLEDKP